MNHLDEFDSAWQSPQFIQIELDPIDVNKVLDEHYQCLSEFAMTKSQLWDMEVKKARKPDLFIPSVIKPESAAAWEFTQAGDIETFTRVSEQRMWLDETRYGVVIEHVHIDHSTHVVTFIGAMHASSERHGQFTASTAQPIFHVQHGVTGDEDNPYNTWKIVHLVSKEKEHLKKRFERMNHAKWLPEYVEIYLRDVIGLQFNRRQ